jgi:hypothetical protein
MSMERVKQFKDLMVDYDATGGTLSVDVWTDMPGSTMATRKVTALAITTGRQTKNIPLDGIEGTLIKVKFTPANTAVVRLYAATVRVRAIGVYLDGTNAEVWNTQEIGFGI